MSAKEAHYDAIKILKELGFDTQNRVIIKSLLAIDNFVAQLERDLITAETATVSLEASIKAIEEERDALAQKLEACKIRYGMLNSLGKNYEQQLMQRDRDLETAWGGVRPAEAQGASLEMVEKERDALRERMEGAKSMTMLTYNKIVQSGSNAGSKESSWQVYELVTGEDKETLIRNGIKAAEFYVIPVTPSVSPVGEEGKNEA